MYHVWLAYWPYGVIWWKYLFDTMSCFWQGFKLYFSWVHLSNFSGYSFWYNVLFFDELLFHVCTGLVHPQADRNQHHRHQLPTLAVPTGIRVLYTPHFVVGLCTNKLTSSHVVSSHTWSYKERYQHSLSKHWDQRKKKNIWVWLQLSSVVTSDTHIYFPKSKYMLWMMCGPVFMVWWKKVTTPQY